MSTLQPSDNEECLIRKLLWDDVLAERVKIYTPDRSATDDRHTEPTREGIGCDRENGSAQESEILRNFSDGIPAHLPHICHAPPYQGHTLAYNVAKEGKRVIVFAPPYLQPKQCGRWDSEAIVVQADIESSTGFHVAAEALQDHFDLIVFIRDPATFSDRMFLTESEDMLMSVHMWHLLNSRERVFKLLPEEDSDNVVLLNPPTVKFVDRSADHPLN
ncbi:hypothetical protein [Sinorhizobium psoraleae]|uniref:Uncharacterized protein n=1 Tax=Sinorhizobium psoraleae TaxID=520838 RepID=A0ABT4KI27_9HYPH|nr:hypothetical protein [Sinorhizobium psoraleae]MCZ4090612.1 hypothetical protein [Sinorhizobium psoraleae]